MTAIWTSQHISCPPDEYLESLPLGLLPKVPLHRHPPQKRHMRLPPPAGWQLNCLTTGLTLLLGSSTLTVEAAQEAGLRKVLALYRMALVDLEPLLVASS